jgi:hypothetical protein
MTGLPERRRAIKLSPKNSLSGSDKFLPIFLRKLSRLDDTDFSRAIRSNITQLLV